MLRHIGDDGVQLSGYHHYAESLAELQERNEDLFNELWDRNSKMKRYGQSEAPKHIFFRRFIKK